MRLIALATVLFVAGCGNVPISVDAAPGATPTTVNSARTEPSLGPVVTIDSEKALTVALEQVGITDVHPVKSQNGQPAAWASVPKLKTCPIYVQVVYGSEWSVSHMQNAAGEIKPINMEGFTISPTAADLATWALTNPLQVAGCLGDKAPSSWPTGPPAN